jgi:hypothetical protein
MPDPTEPRHDDHLLGEAALACLSAAPSVWEPWNALSTEERRTLAGQVGQAARAALQAQERSAAVEESINLALGATPGWSPRLAGKLIQYAQAMGVPIEELSKVQDRRLWEVLHKTFTAEEDRLSAGPPPASASL